MDVERDPAQRFRAADAHTARLRARMLALALGLALLTACGGEGTAPSRFPVVPPSSRLDGLSGSVHLTDRDLGRIVEQEPNDTVAQAFALSPTWARCSFDVTGLLGTTVEHYGRIDVVDAFRFVSLSEQDVTLTLSFQDDDPVGGAANEVSLSVFDTESGGAVGAAPAGPSPLTVTFGAVAEQSFDIVVGIASGHTSYVLRVETRDPIGPPPSARRTAPDAGGAAVGAPAGTGPSLLPDAVTAYAADEPPCADTHVLVQLREGCDAAAFCGRRGLSLMRRMGGGSYRMAFETPDGESGRRKAVALGAALAADSDVLWAEPDWIVHSLSTPDDPSFNRQWNMRMVGAEGAWPQVTGDENVVVAVLDSGIVSHPDLDGQVVAGYDFVSSLAVSVDGDGRDPDPTDPGDGFAGSGLSTWHGTHVAGIIAAKQNDGYGVTGIAPGCRVMPIRVLGVGGGLVSDAADGVLYSAALLTTGTGHRLPAPVPIINMSLGLASDSSALRTACERAANQGVFLVAAAGNTGGAVLFPARYPSVFAVSAVNGNFETTRYSCFGREVDIAAPGGQTSADPWNDGWEDGVLSCVQDETLRPFRKTHGYLVGTSQAAPHVAGAAALLLSLNPDLRPADLRALLRGGALDLGDPGDDIIFGAGLLQVQRSVGLALGGMGQPRTDDPKLLMPSHSIRFEGFHDRERLPLFNAGGGRVLLNTLRVSTDDGAQWLTAELEDAQEIDPPVDKSHILLQVRRHLVPPDPGRYSASVRIGVVGGTFEAMRVVMMVQQRTRVGAQLPVVALDKDTMIARRKGFAVPERNYRYFLRGIPAARYILRGGEDVDGDGFFCESFEACGWHGGPTEDDAVPIQFVPGSEPVRGLSIFLSGP